MNDPLKSHSFFFRLFNFFSGIVFIDSIIIISWPQQLKSTFFSYFSIYWMSMASLSMFFVSLL